MRAAAPTTLPSVTTAAALCVRWHLVLTPPSEHPEAMRRRRSSAALLAPPSPLPINTAQPFHLHTRHRFSHCSPNVFGRFSYRGLVCLAGAAACDAKDSQVSSDAAHVRFDTIHTVAPSALTHAHSNALSPQPSRCRPHLADCGRGRGDLLLGSLQKRKDKTSEWRHGMRASACGACHGPRPC